eukprot:CAMPEP_0168725266 /NCGR_PEP_ID=MMETSP0724-20121128/4063_1 /TAXON_ID=265536 /ORGANISM="Amphiprora sp., Strain CCMP467" /LENGTH=886 /DNA_ID=CAMNT_0008772041 /DNA_START=385 /DNA_END=3046 /DNA_ORIENTATION=-
MVDPPEPPSQHASAVQSDEDSAANNRTKTKKKKKKETKSKVGEPTPLKPQKKKSVKDPASSTSLTTASTTSEKKPKTTKKKKKTDVTAAAAVTKKKVKKKSPSSAKDKDHDDKAKETLRSAHMSLASASPDYKQARAKDASEVDVQMRTKRKEKQKMGEGSLLSVQASSASAAGDYKQRSDGDDDVDVINKIKGKEKKRKNNRESASLLSVHSSLASAAGEYKQRLQQQRDTTETSSSPDVEIAYGAEDDTVSSPSPRGYPDPEQALTVPPTDLLPLGQVPVVPGAMSVIPRGFSNDNNSSSQDSSFASEVYQDELTNRPPSEHDELIQANLVDDVVMANAEILKDSDTPEFKRRRRIGICLCLCLILAVVAISVGVSVARNNGGEGETLVVTTAPTTPFPTPSPSVTPSSAPTRLTWFLASGDQNGDNIIDGVNYEEDLTRVGAGGFGSNVLIADITGTPMEEQTNHSTLIVGTFSDWQAYSSDFGGSNWQQLDLFFYFCDHVAGGDSLTDDCIQGSYIETPLTNSIGLVGLSGNGVFLAMDADWQFGTSADGGIALYDLRTMNLLFNSFDPFAPYGLDQHDPAYLPVDILANGRFVIAMNHDATFLSELREDSVWVHELTGTTMAPGSNISVVNSYQWLPPPTSNVANPCPPEETFITCAPLETPLFLVMDETVVAFATGPVTENEFGQQTHIFNTGYRVRVFDYTLQNQIGNTIERGVNWTFFPFYSLAVAANGTILAVGSSQDTPGATSTSTAIFIVQVYQLEAASNTWVALGQPLTGQETGDHFGSSIALNPDGTFLTVGAYYDNSTSILGGRVASYTFDENAVEWVPFGDDIFGPTGSAFGYSIDLHPSGEQLVIGAPQSNRNGGRSGEAFLYRLSGSID